MARMRLNLFGGVLFWAFRLVWTSLVVLAPALGVWVASSLAAYRNGPVWLVCLVGLLLFPIVPVLWDMVSEHRYRRRARQRDSRVLTRWDRVVLRTLVVNLAFLAGLVWWRPEAAFTALSTRGDWFLERVDHPAAERARAALFRAADGLQWLYAAAHTNPYADMVAEEARPGEAPAPQPQPGDVWSDPFARRPEAGAGGEPGPKDTPGEEPAETPRPAPLASATAWPQPAEVHPAVRAMGEAERASIASVGRYLREQEPDPARRIKAIHDFTATHLAYDVAALREDRYPDQSAPAVFAAKLAVCAGYANLMKALGDVTGDEIAVVVGDARSMASEVDGEPHAWNAARVDGLWYLFDPTWDSGHVQGDSFIRGYTTNYLFVPPGLIGVTHFPEDPAWQLREPPLGRGEFARQPMIRPQFFAEGLGLPEDTRSQVTVQRDFSLVVSNPRGRFMLAKALRTGAAPVECEVRGTSTLELLCAGLAPGTYNVQLYTSPTEYGSYAFVGEIQANATG